MTTQNRIAALIRPRCRIPLGEPDENGRVWAKVRPLPFPKRGTQAAIYDFPTPRTEVRALAGEEALYLRFDCALDTPVRLTPRTPSAPLAEVERAFLVIHPANDPTDSFRFEADHKGLNAVSRHRQITGEKSLGGVPDRWSTSAPATLEWSHFCGMNRKGWWVEMVVPWASLGLAGRPTVMGIEYGRFYATGRPAPVLDDASWPGARPRPALGTILEPGEALIGPAAGAPASVEFAPLRFGRNRARLLIGREWPRGAKALRVRTESAEGACVSERVVSVQPGAREVAFEFDVDRSLCSNLDIFAPQRLALEALASRRGPALYTARLPMDRHLGMSVDEPYGEAGGAPAGMSRRDAALDRIIRALPRLERRITTQGAPSDFCLTDAAGRTVVNLMADDAWDRLAAIVEDRFDTTEDRLLAAMALIGQKSVTNLILNHMFFNAAGEAIYHSHLHEKMGPLSILRYGGGPAVARAVALGRYLRQLSDPKTGRPFSVRVVSLTPAGGPQRAGRNSVFGQKTGPIGAVAVECAGGQTLLDPTNFIFFPRADGGLATIEEMLADERLRREGAGRLAALYARLDADELRHEPVNARLTNGVYPELAPDEDRTNRPFDPRERQVLRAITAARGKESEPVEGFLDRFGGRGARDAAVRVQWDTRGLRVRVRVRGVAFDALAGRDREAEQVHLALDTAHGHTHVWRFMASAAGARQLWSDRVSNIQTLFKHGSTEQQSGEAVAAEWGAEWSRAEGGYEAVFTVPWAAVRLRRLPAVIGLNVWVEGRTPAYEQVFLCPPRFNLASDPFSFADLYLDDAAVTLTEIDLGIPTWTQNTGRAVAVNRRARPVAFTLRAENHLAMRRCVTRSKETRVRLAAGETRAVEFPFYVSPEEKMIGPQEVRLVARQGKTEVFRGAWSIGYCGPLSAFERYGSAIGAARNPRPGERDFMMKKIRFLCSRIPQFRRLCTRDGAPSDFFLRAEDGSAEFNLMKPGVMQEMADFVASRFDTDLDRVLGMWMFSHAPFLARHMSWGHRIVEGGDPLSVIRANFAGGGGNCGYHSRVFGGLACHLKLRGKYLNAHGSVGVWGHVISAVGWRGSKSLIDADVGHVFLKPDGSDLATLEEMRANPDVLTTAGPAEVGRYYTVPDFATRIRKTMLGEPWLGALPPGAPMD